MIFKEWKNEDFIEDSGEGPGHYLPHRGVFKNESTTKIRPVFDVSCKSRGNHSLNDCLMKGPNLQDLIPSVLKKFREKTFGFVSDIKKAFFIYLLLGKSENT
ncbi:pro-Pol polyprotein [Trichonephila clavata]|uniref:Pro-Pol polyprotein n=1 Tax=Trichonephila clavata TaxID=2740835 RepID=A0A8X6J2B8_TRICU|nr:pro-Pol polyprotein [Trichonephila clavata]